MSNYYFRDEINRPEDTSEKSTLPISKDRLKGEKGMDLVRSTLIVVIVSVILFILLTILFGFGIYKYHWKDPFTRAISKAVPYPAGFVNYTPIWYSEFQKDVEAVNYFYANNDDFSPLTQDEASENIFNRFVKDIVVQKLAKEHDVSVTKEELDKEFMIILNSADEGDDFELQLHNSFNWTEDQFKDRILQHHLLEQSLKTVLEGEGVTDNFAEYLNEQIKKANVRRFIE